MSATLSDDDLRWYAKQKTRAEGSKDFFSDQRIQMARELLESRKTIARLQEDMQRAQEIVDRNSATYQRMEKALKNVHPLAHELCELFRELEDIRTNPREWARRGDDWENEAGKACDDLEVVLTDIGSLVSPK